MDERGVSQVAINKLLLAALRALSYNEMDVKKNYQLQRNLQTATHIRKPIFEAWDYVVMSQGKQVPVRIYHPGENNAVAPILLFFHGGGWVTGNIDTYNDVCATMAAITGHRVVSVDYRLAPEDPFPAGLLDCYAVSYELFSHPNLLMCEADNITLIGDSAGANLAAAVSLMARDRGEFLPKKQILIYPATYNDHSENSPFESVRENGTDYLLTSKRVSDYMDLYQSKAEDRGNPYFAPLVCEDLSNQPDTLIITAEYDPLRDEGEAYGKALADAGGHCRIERIEDGLHGFFSLPPGFSMVKEAYRIINEFLGREGDGA